MTHLNTAGLFRSISRRFENDSLKNLLRVVAYLESRRSKNSMHPPICSARSFLPALINCEEIAVLFVSQLFRIRSECGHTMPTLIKGSASDTTLQCFHS